MQKLQILPYGNDSIHKRKKVNKIVVIHTKLSFAKEEVDLHQNGTGLTLKWNWTYTNMELHFSIHLSLLKI